MTAQNFVQLHLLTFYPPSNPNRDDSNRPKTAQVGGVERLRLSSQALKRAVRNSEAFKASLASHSGIVSEGYLGARTRRMGRIARERLIEQHNLSEIDALKVAKILSEVFGKPDPKPEDDAFTRQLAFVTPAEFSRLESYVDRIGTDAQLRTKLVAASAEVGLPDEDETDEQQSGSPPAGTEQGAKKAKTKKRSKEVTVLIQSMRKEILVGKDHAVDVALFGRMFADAPGFNREAAAQVAHSFTTHRVALDDDFYTAVDDLKKPGEEDAGAGFIGDLAFGSGVHYLYACVDRDLLLRNLGREAEGSAELASAGIKALVEGFATTSPGGKRKAFAHNPRASYVLAERGDAQPRSLAIAFLKPVRDDDLMAKSIERLEETCIALDKGYGDNAESRRILNLYGDSKWTAQMPLTERVATLAELAAFCAAP